MPNGSKEKIMASNIITNLQEMILIRKHTWESHKNCLRMNIGMVNEWDPSNSSNWYNGMPAELFYKDNNNNYKLVFSSPVNPKLSNVKNP